MRPPRTHRLPVLSPPDDGSTALIEGLSVEQQVWQALSNAVASITEENGAAAEDVLRMFVEHATLDWQTQVLQSTLTSDPFERWAQDDERGLRDRVQRLQQRLKVVNYHRVHTKDGYVNLEATVRLSPAAAAKVVAAAAGGAPAKRKRRPQDGTTTGMHNKKSPLQLLQQQQHVQHHVQLQFRYERTCHSAPDSSTDNTGGGSTVWYSIDLSSDCGPFERLLWVQVWGDGPTPAPGQAKNIEDEQTHRDHDDENEQWSDMDSDDANDEQSGPANQQTIVSAVETDEISHDGDGNADGTMPQNGGIAGLSKVSSSTGTKQQQPDTEELPYDRFVAGIDPDLLQQFLMATELGPVDDVSAFFILMTFPFYEHEWDLVGLLLDAVFGDATDDEDSDDDEERVHE